MNIRPVLGEPQLFQIPVTLESGNTLAEVYGEYIKLDLFPEEDFFLVYDEPAEEWIVSHLGTGLAILKESSRKSAIHEANMKVIDSRISWAKIMQDSKTQLEVHGFKFPINVVAE